MGKHNLVSEGILTPVYLEDDEEGRIETFKFELDPDLPWSVVGTRNKFDNANGKAAIRAYADLLSHGIWDNPNTDFETGSVFIRATADMDAFYASDVGYITAANNDPKYPHVSEKQFPGGVAWLHRINGKFKITTLDGTGEEAQERYVEWLTAASLGYNLEVRVLPFPEWANAVLANLSIDDHQVRLDGRNEAYGKAIEKKNLYRKGQKLAGKVKAGDADLQPSIVVKLWGSEDTVDLMELPMQTVKIHTSRGNEELRTWDPGSFGSRVTFQTVASTRGYSVELDPKL